jgi:hypothetical protein
MIPAFAVLLIVILAISWAAYQIFGTRIGADERDSPVREGRRRSLDG